MTKRTLSDEKIKAANARFHKLPPAKQRVAIAKDVLASIRTRKLRPRRGRYLNINFGDGYDVVYSRGEIQPLLLGGAKCEACAVGSCFLSAARLGDKQKGIQDLWHIHQSPSSAARRHFSKEQLALMEFAFERFSVRMCSSEDGVGGLTSDLQAVAAKFRNRYRSDESRLSAIMRNIIKNKGEFCP